MRELVAVTIQAVDSTHADRAAMRIAARPVQDMPKQMVEEVIALYRAVDEKSKSETKYGVRSAAEIGTAREVGEWIGQAERLMVSV